MKRAFCITAFMLPLLVASTSFAPEAHPWAPFSANESAMREPTALISSSGHADEEEPSIFPDGFPSVFPVPNTTATLSPSELSSQSGDDVVYRRGPTVVESTLPPSPGPASAVKYADVPFTHSSGLSVTYNAFDLPERISQGTALKAKYTYTADGTKVSALDASGAGLVYRGPFTYRRTSGGSLSFESATFDRGRLTEAGVRYHVTDHLGSVRAVIDGSASTAAYPLAGFYSTDDYAPYGTKSASSASSYLSLASTGTTVSLRDGFTGKENQGPDFSVGYIDFGARQYSPSISRWLVPDPMGEKYYDVSPYVYCGGDPVNLVDPDGRALRVHRRVHKTIVDLAKIAATKRGELMISKLAEKPRVDNRMVPVYNIVPVPFTKWANFNGRDINYVTVPFVSADFGSPSEIAYFSHELSHAYDSFVGNTPVPLMQSFSQKATTESNAVSFENYIRSVYGVPFLRKQYPEFQGSSMFHPVTERVKGESIIHFREINKGKDGRSFGFRYVSLIDGTESTHYIVAGIDDNRYFYFNIYDTEEEYLERTEGWL